MTDTTQTPSQARLAAARAAVADLEQRNAADGLEAVHTPAVRPLAPGDTVHCLKTGTTVHTGGQFMASGVVLTRGDNVVITQALLDANRNRLGEPVGVALAGDPQAQLAKWGELRFALGEAPADLRPWIVGDPNWAEQRERARRAAHRETDPDRRAEALSAVTRIYGAAPVTSTSRTLGPDNAYEAQQGRLAGRATPKGQ